MIKRPTQEISKLRYGLHLDVPESARLHQYIKDLEEKIRRLENDNSVMDHRNM